MAYVITCGDEGVQINEGRRIGVLGVGFRLDGFSEVLKYLKKTLGEDLRVVSNEENDWIKEQLDLGNWEQVNASSQQHIEALADQEGLLYSGYLPFSDPRQLQHEIRGHMVRPHAIHIANKICFTLGGGEQVYNLGNFVVSADWIADAPLALVKSFLNAQVAFYTKLSKGEELKLVFEEGGELGPEVAKKNRAKLEKAGFVASIIPPRIVPPPRVKPAK